MYRALYRKWRPQRFDDVLGQQAITTALKNQISNGKIGHAYMFTGTRGTGKTTCAKLFAKAVNCETPHDAEPCGQCEVCTGLENGSILDVMEIDAASNNGVDDVRELREETAYRPSRCRYRVYIIDEVHMLSTSAFNALLKILEEPPSHVIFILATTEIHKVPATILSRCQRFDFMRIEPRLIAERLRYIAGQEDIELTDGAADLIARLADGAMRDANSLLDTCAGLGDVVDEPLVRRMAGVADKSYLFGFSNAVQMGDTQKCLALLGDVYSQSIDIRRLTEELVLHYRNLLLALAAPDGSLLVAVPRQDVQQYLDKAPQVGEGFAIEGVRRLAAAMDKMGRSPDPRIELELALFDLCQRAGAPAAAQPAAAAVPAPMAPAAPPPPAPAEPQTLPTQAAPIPPAAEPPPAPEAEPQKPAPPPQRPEEEPAATLATEEGPVSFEQWEAVVQRMAGVNRMLHSFMKGANAYTDGKRVLIAADEVFRSYLNENKEMNACIKQVITEVTGKRYGIGPYTPPAHELKDGPKNADDTLERWQENGVEIKYE